MDPLSDVMAVLHPASFMFGGLSATGAWALHFPEEDAIKCYVIVADAVYLRLDGYADALTLRRGDAVLLPSGAGFTLASDLDAAPLDAGAFFAAPLRGGIATLNGGGELVGIGGYFEFGGAHAGFLIDRLPPVVRLERATGADALRWAVERIMDELRVPLPGGRLVMQHLIQIVLLETLRRYVAEGDGAGWLAALADPPLRAAITVMHEQPAYGWTLPELAERAGLARSTFAERFKSTVGMSPIEYLTRWRMLVAADRLTNSRDSVARIAEALGYESDSAFSTAFKRVMGCSPRRYGRDGGTPAA